MLPYIMMLPPHKAVTVTGWQAGKNPGVKQQLVATIKVFVEHTKDGG